MFVPVCNCRIIFCCDVHFRFTGPLLTTVSLDPQIMLNVCSKSHFFLQIRSLMYDTMQELNMYSLQLLVYLMIQYSMVYLGHAGGDICSIQVH